jgi:hypothetical protein
VTRSVATSVVGTAAVRSVVCSTTTSSSSPRGCDPGHPPL